MLRVTLALVFVPIIGALLLLGGRAFGADGTSANAQHLIEKSGLSGGTIVHLGCGNGSLTAALGQSGRFIVQGLEPDAARLNDARTYIKAQQMYGMVSVDTLKPKNLPYADNLVDLVVIDDLPRMLAAGLDFKEAWRITCPGGWVCVSGSGGSGTIAPGQDLKSLLNATGVTDVSVENEPSGWSWVQKPRPGTMGEWTHAIGGESGGSSVSQDDVGPTRSLQWVDGPRSPMGRWRTDGTLIATAGGKSFYVTVSDADLLSTNRADRLVNPRLVCRDAFNGVRLWSQPIFDGPDTKPDKGDGVLVASSDIVAVLDPMGGLRVFETKTGKVMPAFSSEGNIYTGFRPNMRMTAGQLLISDQRNLAAYDTSSGRLIWSKKFEALKQDPSEPPSVKPESVMVAIDGKVFDQRGNEITCYNITDGNILWKLDGASLTGKPVASFKLDFSKNGIVVAESLAPADGNGGWTRYVHGISADGGKVLWSYQSRGHTHVAGSASGWRVVYAAGQVWVQTQTDPGGDDKTNAWDWIGLNPQTGAVGKDLKMAAYILFACYQESSTENYFICGRPPNFFDWKSGELNIDRVVRGTCIGGTVIANNLLYSGPNGCGCIKDTIRGFSAFSSHPPAHIDPAAIRLEQGPEFGKQGNSPEESGWTTFRGDAARSGATQATSSPDLKLQWESQVADQKLPGEMIMGDWNLGPQTGDVLTQITAGDGLVFVSQIQSHTVSAIDPPTGKKVWEFVASGRLDTPPTVYKGMCLVGSHDGYVYCLRGADGKLLWKFRAAPEDRRVMAFGQMESPWPVVGGVMVDHGLTYFVAGHTTSLDGGIHVYAVKPESGELVWEKHYTTENEALNVGEKKNADSTFEGAADLLMSDGKLVSMTGWWNLDPLTGEIKNEPYDLLRSSQASAVSNPGELLNSDWRWDLAGGDRQNYWANPPYFFSSAFDSQNPGQPGLLVFDQTNLFGYFGFNRLRKTLGEDSLRLQPVLFGVKRTDVDKLYSEWDPQTARLAREINPKQATAPAPASALWYEDIQGNLQVESMAFSSGYLYVAGVRDFTNRSQGAFLRAYSVADGKMVKEIPLESPTSAEGLSISDGKLYVSLHNGKLLCFGGQ
jgi:outer membrane protein assembly factor BamB